MQDLTDILDEYLQHSQHLLKVLCLASALAALVGLGATLFGHGDVGFPLFGGGFLAGVLTLPEHLRD